MAIQDSIKNTKVISGSSLSFRSYQPKQYTGIQKQYYKDENALFIEQYAKYSSDYIEAQIQGIDPENPLEYTTAHIRFANVVRPSASIANNFDNFKYILVAEKECGYLRKGAKIEALGSTWLVINPDNLSGATGNAVIQRCDASWHYLDWYGKLCSEPIAINDLRMKANDADSQRSSMITKGYFNVKAQYNDATKQLFTNSRLILGSSAYRITGYSDFIQEFTDDDNSINMVEFSIRYEEPNDAIDDMKNRVAGGKVFNWEMKIEGEPTIEVGTTTTVKATSTRNNEPADNNEEHPTFYLWRSSNEDVAIVDDFGTVTALSEGETTITAILEQNKKNRASFNITVAGQDTTPHVAFTSTIPVKLSMYESVTLTALYFVNGQATSDTVSFDLTNADEQNYSYEIDGNNITIKCWGGDVKPITITAICNGQTAIANIELEGI